MTSPVEPESEQLSNLNKLARDALVGHAITDVDFTNPDYVIVVSTDAGQRVALGHKHS